MLLDNSRYYSKCYSKCMSTSLLVLLTLLEVPSSATVWSWILGWFIMICNVVFIVFIVTCCCSSETCVASTVFVKLSNLVATWSTYKFRVVICCSNGVCFVVISAFFCSVLQRISLIFVLKVVQSYEEVQEILSWVKGIVIAVAGLKTALA